MIVSVLLKTFILFASLTDLGSSLFYLTDRLFIDTYLWETVEVFQIQSWVNSCSDHELRMH